jgi:hypothetical protein
MPISTTLFLACMTVMRLLCFAVAALFLLLAIRAQFDASIQLSWLASTAAAGLFIATGFACGFLRDALQRRANARPRA